jgi:predicted DNA-binding ribbon-helix-helix protein
VDRGNVTSMLRIGVLRYINTRRLSPPNRVRTPKSAPSRERQFVIAQSETVFAFVVKIREYGDMVIECDA